MARQLLLITGVFQLVGGTVISVLPLPFLPFQPEQSGHHYVSHVVLGVAQLPLIVITFQNASHGRAKEAADSHDDLIRRALAVNQAWLTLGNECFEAEGATFVRNRAIPGIYDANRVAQVTAETLEATDRLMGQVEREFAGYAHRRFDVDFTTPPAFEARLVLDGYLRNEALVMLLEGDLIGAVRPHEIRAVVTEADWRTLHDLDWLEGREKQNESPAEAIGSAMARSKRGKSPPVRYWIACLDGHPQAYFSSWASIDGVGQIEDLFTHPDFRHRGLATALIHHCVADYRKLGAGPVVIVADANDTPKHMYAAMGFRPIAVKRNYRKHVAL